MLIKVLRSKIHRARVTDAHLEYEGSITIDEDLMDAAGFIDSEAVLVANLSTGSRHETYVMKGERGSGTICANGAAARLTQIGDRVIILGFAYLDPKELLEHVPRKIVLDDENRIVRGPRGGRPGKPSS
jgi:aspartate 1-decarboxylase